MADLNSSLGLSEEEAATITTAASTPTVVASSMLWEGWSSQPSSSTPDDVSTSDIAMLADLSPPPSFTSRFQHPSDLLSNMLSSFHLLPVPTSDNNTTFLHQLEPSDSEATTVSFAESSRASTYLSVIPYPSSKRDDLLISSSQWNNGASQLEQTVPGSSSSSREYWDASPWPGTTTIQLFHEEDDTTQLTEFGRSSEKLETFSSLGATSDHPSEMNPVLVVTPPMHETTSTAWIPTSATRDRVVPAFDRTAREQELSVTMELSEQVPVLGGVAARKQNRRGRDELWNEPAETSTASKRSHVARGDEVGEVISMGWRHRDRRGEGVVATKPGGRRAWTHTSGAASSSVSSASQAMEIFAMGPALNTNGQPRARRGSATDPQSVYARHRREKINKRLKVLQRLVPNGTKVDIVTMLDEAVQYVQFLQLQLKLLESDKYWIHATPNIYKGVDLTNQPRQTQGMESSKQEENSSYS